VADRTLRRCARNDKALRALDISDTVFSARFFSQLAEALRHNTTLQELYLDNCHIDDEASRVLARGIEQSPGSRLRALSLEDNEIRCVGAGHLARMLASSGSRWTRTFGGYKAPACGPGRGLQYLSLKGNAISAIGSKAVAEALISSDDSLERLSLEANKINDWGAGWFAMALRNNNVLQCLDLHRNPIGKDGLEELRSACVTAKASLVLLRHTSAAGQQTGGEGSPNDSTASPPTSALPSPKSAGESEATAGQETAAEVEEQLIPLVRGERLATVYLSVYDKAEEGPQGPSGPSSRPGSAYRRPGSASGRREPMSTQRQNRALDIEEPGCSRMADSAPSGGAVDSAEAGCPPPPPPASTRVSAPGLVMGASSIYNTMRQPQRRATPPAVSTYITPERLRTYAGDLPPRNLRARPGERSVGADEKETSTVLVPPSRWRRKLREHSGAEEEEATSAGGAVAAARRLRRAWSAPGLRRGNRLGRSGSCASSACGSARAGHFRPHHYRSVCDRTMARSHGMLLGPTAASGAYGV